LIKTERDSSGEHQSWYERTVVAAPVPAWQGEPDGTKPWKRDAGTAGPLLGIPRRKFNAIPTLVSMSLDDKTFEELVSMWYESLYRFAFSLTRSDADARDLTQETFLRLARKAAQIEDKSRCKSWLFSTLYRAFVDARRWLNRYQHVEVSAADHELPAHLPTAGEGLDAEAARVALLRVDEIFRTPLVLFYLEGHSYLEIADILGVPAGTVMSRLSRGREMLRHLLEDKSNVVPFESLKTQAAS
jgi:RNA polymerase sigma-70 factor (ECF subfamily)